MNYLHTALFLAPIFLTTPAFADVQANDNAPPQLTSHAPQVFQIARRRRLLSWRVGVRPVPFSISAISRSGSSCTSQTKMTAFVPPYQSAEKIDEARVTLDTTLSSHPTLWAYVSSLPQDTQVQFTLISSDVADKRKPYETRFKLTGQTGIVGIRLPDTEPALAIGKSYIWRMRIVCDGGGDLIIGSVIQRSDPTTIKPASGGNATLLLQELARAPEQDKPAIYAELGVWQDAVTTLINLQRKQPNDQDLKTDWRNLLTGARMSELINAPALGMK